MDPRGGSGILPSEGDPEQPPPRANRINPVEAVRLGAGTRPIPDPKRKTKGNVEAG